MARMNDSARSMSRAISSYRSPAGERRTKSWFQAWTWCRSAKPPVAKARSRFSVAALFW